MKKDVIYIDIEDDITAVIDKLKASGEKIIALVPPKGNAVLQSVVNLKLLNRAAKSAGKQPVIVTSNQALTALAGGLEIYVAKNLQSKPTIPSGASIDGGDIEPVEVSDEVGMLDDTPAVVDDDSDEVELTGAELDELKAENDAPVEKKPSKKDKKKIPNFNDFRKKLLIGGGFALVLIIVLGLFFARTKSQIVIRAETTPVDIAVEPTINTNISASDVAGLELKGQSQDSKKTINQGFTPTGQKDLGTKASGTVTFTNCSDDSVTIPAGTSVSSGGLSFVTKSSTSLGAGNFTSGGVCRSTGDHVGSSGVTASENGDKFNLSPRSYTVSAPGVKAQGGQMNGGTSKIVKVVSQEDVDRAKQQIQEQDTKQIKEELKKNFSGNVTILDDSFVTTFGSATSEPAVGQEANEARLSAEVEYSVMAVLTDDLNALLDSVVTDKMTNQDQQKVYDNGFEQKKLERIEGNNKTAKYKVTAVGQFGPKFDTEQLKGQVSGKKVGEVRSYLQDLPGVKSVDINLSPFWARKTPNTSRIDIKIDVDKNIGG